MGRLPKGWVECQIMDIGLAVTGGTPSRKNKNYYKGNIPWIKPGDLKDKFITEYQESLSKTGGEKVRLLPPNSVMVSCIGNLGKIGFIDKVAATNQQINSIVFNGSLVDSKYGFYYSLTLKEWLIANSSATTVSIINKGRFEKAPFILPPLPEQQRIVAKLDALFASLESTKARLERIPQLLKNFRQAVLTQAVTGKLTEQWREGKELDTRNHFDNLILQRKEQYIKECLDAKLKGNRKPTKTYLQELPLIDKIHAQIPNSWSQTNIHFLSFVTKLAGFEYSKHFNLEPEGDIPVVRAQNVQMGRFEDKNRHYLKKETSDYLVRSQLHGRELLMVFIGAGTGNVCLAPTKERWHLAPNVAKIDVQGIDRKYLFYYLQSNLGITNVLSRVKATAQPSLSMETIREIVVLVPDLKEQTEIVRRVESLFAKADAIEEKYKRLKQKIDSLPQAILAKAFRGELVEQLDTDGDAKELLSAIAKTSDNLRFSMKAKEDKKLESSAKPKTKKLRAPKTKLDVAAEGKVRYR